MAAKVHKSLRIEESTVKRIEALSKEGEAFSLAVNRVLAVGCDTLENVTRNIEVEHADIRAEYKAEHDENTKKIITLLENENARLVEEHEADRDAIAEKDRQLAAALAKAHDLAEQSHVLMGMAHEGALPAAAGDENSTGVIEVSTAPQEMGFWKWVGMWFNRNKEA